MSSQIEVLAIDCLRCNVNCCRPQRWVLVGPERTGAGVGLPDNVQCYVNYVYLLARASKGASRTIFYQTI